MLDTTTAGDDRHLDRCPTCGAWRFRKVCKEGACAMKVCRCGHLEAEHLWHDKAGERRGCETAAGARATPCGCRRFDPVATRHVTRKVVDVPLEPTA